MKTERKELLVKVLRRLSDGSIKPVDNKYGLCQHLVESGFGSELYGLIEPIFEYWPEFSGARRFPVPHPDGYGDAEVAYEYTVNKWIGKYGASRKRLCRWLADELEKML